MVRTRVAITTRRKRTKKSEPRAKGFLRTKAIEVLVDITSDLSSDWTIQEIAAEAKRRHLVPHEVYEHAQDKAIVDWLGEAGRQSKKNIGTERDPKRIRIMGVYYVTEQNEDGTDAERACWREWPHMDRDQMTSAQQSLYQMAKSMKREAFLVHTYCNKILTDRGDELIALEDVK